MQILFNVQMSFAIIITNICYNMEKRMHENLCKILNKTHYQIAHNAAKPLQNVEIN